MLTSLPVAWSGPYLVSAGAEQQVIGDGPAPAGLRTTGTRALPPWTFPPQSHAGIEALGQRKRSPALACAALKRDYL